MARGGDTGFGAIPSWLPLRDGAAEITARIPIDASAQGTPISPLLYGIFFEEINHAGDGGLYAELVRNRSFEDADTPDAWTLVSGSVNRLESHLKRALTGRVVCIQLQLYFAYDDLCR
jgi:hypothetical protein